MKHAWGKWEMYKKFWSENLNGSDHSEDLYVDGRINTRNDIIEKGWEGMDCIHLTQDRNQ
jgi:hypothetical protein